MEKSNDKRGEGMAGECQDLRLQKTIFSLFFSLDYSEVEDYKEKAHSNF